MFNLSFLGWFALSIITCGILLLYVLPYYYISLSIFITSARNKYYYDKSSSEIEKQD